ncbi:hypothetical protein [Bacillus sonorensis]|uniref:hypothetical protein n=1 Tax=Bacillus sonorensis TaxID=119858 RepID=UPI001F2A4338|nr:hypothetical protein [Bacillus sonorensis]MCF7619368.1 hypothetical protein [Bacillus sonorensis]MCY8271743.1 hypothetical protein [Bacillus sonorensis]MCY8562625.1 hypothetical protein [Bacillus sonorensis]MCY8604933.1 hypothetical protein [Bacillus sonorensis]MEC1501629.1 hypothetical protein [Bacillus sonorensis]
MAADDFFTKMMFGANRSNNRENQSTHEERPDIENEEETEELNEPDYMHILDQVGQIMDSIDELKPVFKEIGSMVSSLKNKISM